MALMGGMLAGEGCGPTGPSAVPGADRQNLELPAYDPQRAFLPLDKLDGTGVGIPQPTAEAKPLSTRGARLIDQAIRLDNQQRYTEAALELERALQSDPDSYEVHLQLARVLRAAGSIDRSRTHLQRALALHPDDLVLHYLLGLSARDDGETSAEVHEFRIALKCSNAGAVPDFRALVLFRLAESLEQEGYLTAALEAYRGFEQTAAALADQTEVARELADLRQVTGGNAAGPTSAIHERLGQFSQAADALARTAEGQPPDAPTQPRLIRLLSQAGRHEEALDRARRLVEHDPSTVEVLLEAYRRAGRPDGALKDLADLAARKPGEPKYLLAHVATLEALRRPSQAEPELERFLEAHPEQLEVRWRLCDLYVGRRAWADALALLARAVAADYSAAPAARSKLLELPAESCQAVLQAAAPPAPETARRDRREGPAASAYGGLGGQTGGPSVEAATSYLLGCVALHVGDLERAAALLEQADLAAPGFAAAQTELGAVYNALYRWSDTLALLARQGGPAPALGAQDQAARAEWLIGQAYDGLDETEQASARYSSAARLDPRDPRPLRALAQLFERSGDLLRATRQYRAVLDLDPVDEESREALFGLCLRTGDREAAAAQLDELRKVSASPNRVARCLGLLQNDPRVPDLERFRRTLTQAMEASQPDARSLAFIAATYLDEAQYEAALAALDRAVELAPDDVDILLAREYACRMNLQFEQSADALRGLLRRHPNRTQWINGLIDVLVTDQNFDGALEVLGRQLAREPLDDKTRAEYREAWLEVLRRARRLDEQIAAVKRWQAEQPDDVNLRIWLLGAYLAAERPQEALSVVEPWYAEEPGNGPLREQFVDLLVEVGKADRAFQVVLGALANDPDNDDLQLLLVTALAQAGRHDDALELATNGAVGAGRTLEYQWRMLGVYGAAGRHEEAIRLIGEMLHQVESGGPGTPGPDADDLQLRLAGHLILDKQYNEAQVRLSRWAEDSTSPAVKVEYLKLLSGCHQARGQPGQAAEALGQAYSLRPLDAGVNNDLAYHFADAGVRLDEAERLLRYAVAQEPRNDAFLDSLGWVAYKKGDIDGALKWLTRAVGAGPGDDPVMCYHLGDALWRAGAAEEALENWRAAERYAGQRLEETPAFNEAEYRQVLQGAGERIARVESGQRPEVAPLGQAVEPAAGGKETPAEEPRRAPWPIR